MVDPIDLFPELKVVESIVIQEQLNESNTQGFYQDFTLGPLFPSDLQTKRIMDIINEFRDGKLKGNRITLTFNLETGETFEMMIYRPYRLRRYKMGEIVKVYSGL